MTEQLAYQPLAAKMRPCSIEDIIGQTHLLGEGKPLHRACSQGHWHSMIFWGPPGVGKTTLSKVLMQSSGYPSKTLSAVSAGVKDIRQAVEDAKKLDSPMWLFVDEVHRFNKGQQDALLPWIEDGTFLFIGATTENPSFHLNNALLSRTKVYVLKALQDEALLSLLNRALRLSGQFGAWSEPNKTKLIEASLGDARKLLNHLDVLVSLIESDDSALVDDLLEQWLQEEVGYFDKGGDQFYDQISALHKSVRGSNPDASLYWLARMLKGGADPFYIARRLIRMASEDIGNADPRALTMTLNAWESYERLGAPEGDLALAQAVSYLACAAKSNAVYNAFKQASQAAERSQVAPVPMHLRNAPTKLLKQMGASKGYRYAHDEPHAYAAGETYLPDSLIGERYYVPTDRGLEKKIRDKLAFLNELDSTAKS